MSLSPNLLKFIAAAALFGLWAVLVWNHFVPPGDLAHAIEAALLGLGVFHAVSNQPAPPPAPPPPPPAAATPPQQSPTP